MINVNNNKILPSTKSKYNLANLKTISLTRQRFLMQKLKCDLLFHLLDIDIKTILRSKYT